MVKVKSSLADLLRNHINQQLENNFDYSLSSNRKQDIQNFISSHQTDLSKDQSNIKTIRPSHNKILDDCMKNKGIDPASLGRKSKKPKFNSDLKPNITPEPQAGVPDSSPAPKVDSKGLPIPVAVIPETFDVKAVSASINSLYLMLRTIYPDLELLSEEEKDSLGTLWKSAFNKYLTDSFAEILIPIMATFGIFAPKILQARKKKQLRKIDSKLIPDHIQEQADKIKDEVAKKEEEEKQEELVKSNDAIPASKYKIGEVDSNINV